jgi:hypothetical protein
MRYEPASRTPAATGCQPGTRALGQAVKNVYPELISLAGAYGCFNPRKIAGSESFSLHAEGRAIDVGVPQSSDALGWDLACELVSQRVVYGTMRVIWDRHIWSLERGDRWAVVQPGTQEHRDHIHVEQFWSAANRPLTSQVAIETALRAHRASKES